MRLRLPLDLRRALASLAVLASTPTTLEAAVTINQNVTLDDTSGVAVNAANVAAGTIYGRINASSALTLDGMILTVNHGEGASLSTWAGLVMVSPVDTTTFTFTNATLSGNGNLALCFESGNYEQHPSTNLSTLDGNTAGSEFTGRILLMDQWNNGLTASYQGELLKNAEIVLSKDGTRPVVGGSALATGTNRYANVLNLTGSASLAGISAEAKGTSSGAQNPVIQTTGAGTNTLTLTGGCTTNQNYVFAGTAGTASAYVNLAVQGGNQTFSGTSYFGDVAVSGGSLTFGSATTLKGNVAVTGGTLHLAGATLKRDARVSLGGGLIDGLVLSESMTLEQTAPGGTLGNLSLNGGTISFGGLDNVSYSLSGTLAIQAAITGLDFTGSLNYGVGSTLFSNVTFADGFVWNDALWAQYFVFSGTDQNWKVVFDSESSSLKLAVNDAAQLTWNNTGNSGVWNATDANWGDPATVFHSGDAVTFSGTTGAVAVDSAGVVASAVAIDGAVSLTLTGGPITGPTDVVNGSTVTFSGGTVSGTMNIDGASQVTLQSAKEGNVTLSGGSTLVVGSGGSVNGNVALSDTASKLTLSSVNSLSSSATVTGAGIVDIHWADKGANGNIAGRLTAFTGTLQISAGRYNAVADASIGVSDVTVTNGGQFYITGGTWNKNFTIAGEGWTNSDDPAKKGALRFDGGTVQGKITLSDNASILVWSSNTATITGAIDTAGHTLTKNGAGTLLFTSTGTLNGIDLRVAEGTLKLGTSETTPFSASPASLEVGGGATVLFRAGTTNETKGGSSVVTTNLTLRNNSTISIEESRPNIQHIDTTNITFKGNVTLDDGMASLICLYGKSIRFDSEITGKGGLRMTNDISDNPGWVGRFCIYLTDADNSFEGGVEILRQGGCVQATSVGALGTGILNLDHVDSLFQYAYGADAQDGVAAPPAKEEVLDQIIKGRGSVEVLSGNLTLAGRNEYTGSTTVSSQATLKVSGSIGSDTLDSANTYVVEDGASLVVSGSGSVANSAVTISANRPAASTLADTGDASAIEGTLGNVTVDTNKIARTNDAAKAVVDHGRIDIAVQSYSIENVELVNSLVSMRQAGSLTLANVTIGEGTVLSEISSIALTGNTTLVMTQANTTVGSFEADSSPGINTLHVSSSALAGVTSLTGSLTLDLTKQWIDWLVGQAEGHFQMIELTFENVDAAGWKAFQEASGDNKLATTGALNSFSSLDVSFGEAGGVVLISTAPQNIPEPASVALSLAGFAALLLRRRR